MYMQYNLQYIYTVSTERHKITLKLQLACNLKYSRSAAHLFCTVPRLGRSLSAEVRPQERSITKNTNNKGNGECCVNSGIYKPSFTSSEVTLLSLYPVKFWSACTISLQLRKWGNLNKQTEHMPWRSSHLVCAAPSTEGSQQWSWDSLFELENLYFQTFSVPEQCRSECTWHSQVSFTCLGSTACLPIVDTLENCQSIRLAIWKG